MLENVILLIFLIVKFRKTIIFQKENLKQNEIEEFKVGIKETISEAWEYNLPFVILFILLALLVLILWVKVEGMYLIFSAIVMFFEFKQNEINEWVLEKTKRTIAYFNKRD